MSSAIIKDSARTSECPSELALDRHQQGEIEGDERARLDQHVPTCEHCQGRLAERAALFEAMAPAERRQMIDRILEAAPQVEPNEAAPQSSWWSRTFDVGWFRDWGLAPTLVAAAAAVVFIAVRPLGSPTESDGEIVRTKGGLGLKVFLERDGQVEEAHSGQPMSAGDRLRFGVEVPEDGHVMIIGREASGESYVAFPTDGDRRSRAVSAGHTDALPGAVELDDSAGREVLRLVFCPEPFQMDAVSSLDDTEIAERGCSATPFELSKEAH